ncbi:MAG: ATP-binding protein [Pseudomonadota bacterium]
MAATNDSRLLAPERLSALRHYGVLDTPREKDYDDLVQLAAGVCGTPYAVINFVDGARQWFKAEIGFGVRETPLESSICAQVMLESALVEIPNLQHDARFTCNALVTAGPELRFYAGAPLQTPEGQVLGTLCVLDNQTRTLSALQRNTLMVLARQVVTLLELRRHAALAASRAEALERLLGEQQDTQQAQRQAEAHHRYVVDHMQAGLVVHAADDGAVLFSNEVASQLLGLDSHTLRGKSLTDQAWHFLRADRSPMPPSEYPVACVLATGEPVTGQVVGILHSGASEPRWVLVNAYPGEDGTRSQAHIVVSFVDITVLKKAEEQLRQADQAKDEFIATLAHELRNPLAPIRSAAATLALHDLPADKVAWCQSVIARQVANMGLLLDDLLDASRISRGQLELRQAAVPLQEVVDAAVEVVRPLIDRKHHTLQIETLDANVVLQADGLRLAQVLANLLTNAAKYTPPNGTLTLRAKVEGPSVLLSVQDNGIGLSPEVLPTVFGMFTQVRSVAASTLSEGGLGIGLSLAQGLMRLHGGHIEAHSDGLGLGSRFTAHLPQAIVTTATLDASANPDLAAPPALTAPAKTEGTAPSPRSILVVDDNRDAAESLALLLEYQGHRVHQAHSGEAALSLLRTVQADFALIDIGMPGMGGHGLARQLRLAHPSPESMMLVALTGWGQRQDIERSKAAGFDHHLVKPVALEKILALLV